MKGIYNGRNDFYYRININKNLLVVIAPSYLNDAESYERIKNRNLSEKILNKFLYRQFPDRAAALI